MELAEELEMGLSLFQLSPAGSSAFTQEARFVFSSTQSEGLMLMLSSSEGVDIVSIEAGEFEELPALSPAYEELVEVVTHAITKLNINWLTEKQEVHQKAS